MQYSTLKEEKILIYYKISSPLSNTDMIGTGVILMEFCKYIFNNSKNPQIFASLFQGLHKVSWTLDPKLILKRFVGSWNQAKFIIQSWPSWMDICSEAMKKDVFLVSFKFLLSVVWEHTWWLLVKWNPWGKTEHYEST